MDDTDNSDSTQALQNGRAGFVISKRTMDALLRHERAADMIALLAFYSYTALWQRTNQPHCTIAFIGKGLRWGADKVRAIRRELATLKLIEDVVQRDEKGRKTGWFVRLAHFHPTDFQEGGSHPPGLPECGLNHSVDFKCTNALGADKKNALRAGRERRRGSDGKARPTAEKAVVEYCEHLGLPKSDGEYHWARWEANGCTINGKPMRDWKASIRAWKAAGYNPSQKRHGAARTMEEKRKGEYPEDFRHLIAYDPTKE